MISGLCSIFGSLFLFCAFILNLFIVIGQLSNRVFINAVYFAQVTNQQTGASYNLGLWNYCQANQQAVQSCQHPTPAFNWATTPDISQAVPGAAQSTFVKSLFVACFILYFIGLGLSFIFWVLSMPICCTKRRGISVSMTTLVFINLLVNLAALVFSLVFVLRGIYLLHSANSNFSGQAGNALWLSIGSVIALCASFIFYTGACCCIGNSSVNKKRSNQVDPTSRYSKTNLDHPIDRPYQPQQPQIQQLQQQPPQPTMSSPMSGRRSYDFNQSVYQSVGQPSPRVLQQPYQHVDDNANNYSPVIQQQGFEHQPRPETHGQIRVPGYPSSSNKHVVNTTV